MEELQRFRARRRGFKASVTKLLAKIEDIVPAELENVTSESVVESRRVTVSTAIEQLRTKREQITELDNAIAAAIQIESELEAEICDADTYQSTLSERIAFLAEFIRKSNRPPSAPVPTPPRPPSTDRDCPPTLESSTSSTEEPVRVTSKVTPPDTTGPPAATNGTERAIDTNLPERGTYHNYSRLPKLVLPTFSGEPLQWQMFWDSFAAAVDSNPHLTGIQKLNYLRAQLHGDAAHVIAGFPLSDSNYNHSITLLKERFGQQYKLVDAHMEALLNVLTPSNILPSLQAFYDTIQNHMRALSSLGTPPQQDPPKQTLTTMTSTSLSTSYTSVCLLKTAITDISAGPTTVEGHILFDEGAQRSFITQELADKLQLQPTGHENITVSSFGEHISTPKKLTVASILINTLNKGQIPVSVLIVPKLAAPIRNSIRVHLNKLPYLKGLSLAHPVTSDENFHISVLIGADFYWQFIQDHVIRGDGPTAVQSRLGYLLSGPLPLPQSAATTNLHVSIFSCITEDTDHSSFWKVESTGATPGQQKLNADSEFLQQYINTKISLQPDGSYSLRFPWKDNHPPLPSNYTICARRTRSMAYRLAKTPHLLEMYGTIIKEQEMRGFIEKVNNSNGHGSVHYIPHHPVRKQSSTTPIRIVYDCSCRQSLNSPSLNDCLHPGPPFLNDLCAILLRFRQHKFAFSSDIEKAFLHVHLDETDRDFTRFLWLSDPTDANSPFVTFRFKVVLFGATSSPFMLNAALSFHLTRNSSTISKDLLHNLYVDNVVSGCHTEEGAIEYFIKSRSLLNDAKFNLRSWASNSLHLRNTAKEHKVDETDNPVKVLGMWWDTLSDILYPSPKQGIATLTTTVTKREILKWSSSIFDPLGLISPVTISAKLFLQQLWQEHLEWDTALSEKLCKSWHQIASDVVQATQMSFPRQCITFSPTTEATLHIFADASPKAYGAVAYLQQGMNSSLVMSKTRAAPLKRLSLPKLELMAAVLATRLYLFITTSLNMKSSAYLWSDSQIVLFWIDSKKKLKPFVNNRVSEIRSVSTPWRYCPSADNPADLLTRGVTFDHLNSSFQWRHGPTWLVSPPQWPTWQQSEVLHVQTEADNEIEVIQEATPSKPEGTGLHKILAVTEFSRLGKLIAVTAYILRFIHNTRQPATSRNVGFLTTLELALANSKWICHIQHMMFPNEIANLQSQRPRLPLVRQLRLFLDDKQLLRCGGRIHNAPLSHLAKFPYLLPSRHHFTVLVIKDAHVTQLHSGVNATLTALRQMYWIPSARQRIKSVIRKCVVCRKTSGKPYAMPDPPPLVKSRVSLAEPFAVTGVDFTGALYVRSAEGERKVYLCLFTCAVSRAIHLEIVTDLTVECFLQALRRFSGRRSVPKLILSDNASTYLAAAEELKVLFSSPDLAETLSRKGIKWEFIPKRAPWFGGFWERLIGLTKSTLKKTLGRMHATLESLQTITVEVEAILNDRPLTYASSDINDPQPITPAHLLHGRRIVPLPHSTVQMDEISDPDFGDTSELRRRAKAQAIVMEHFWSRWKHEYLTTLREAHRTTGDNMQQVRVGDVVQVHDDTKRVNWRLAVIEAVHKGADGLIRSADIRTATGKTNRPIARLYPLEVSSAEKPVNSPQHNGQSEYHTVDVPSSRPVRQAAQRGQQKVKEWISSLCGPPEDVMNTD